MDAVTPRLSVAPLSSHVLQEASHWASFFGDDWRRDFPTEIHAGGLGEGGTPQWRADFARWLTSSPVDDDRARTTRVMRRLRRFAPREYEVAYRAMILGESFEEITRWLNARAVRNNIPLPPNREIHYTLKDAVVLFLCAIEYARTYW